MQATGDPIEKFRGFCLSRGATGILGIARMFRRMDHSGNGRLTWEEFFQGLQDTGCEISPEEATVVFEKFDANKSGSINADEFLLGLRPPMSENRKRIVHQAFKKMDKGGYGVVDFADIKAMYNFKHHPEYLNGESTGEKILLMFLDNFEVCGIQAGKVIVEPGTGDGKVTEREFMDYYCGVSALIDKDEYFDLMMRQAWEI